MKSYGVTIHSNDTPLTVLSCGRYYLYLSINKVKFSTHLGFSFWALLGVKGLNQIHW